MKTVNPLFEGSEWTIEEIEETWKVIDDVGKNVFHLDYYKPQLEIITYEQMLDNYSSTGIPNMYRHWSFGKRFIKDHNDYVNGKSGLAYEMVINTDPAVTYLMENNTMTMQALVMAHAVCVDKDTEVLTPEGWVKISEWEREKLPIAQYSENGRVEFKQPQKYVKMQSGGFYHIKARGVSQKVTPDHTLIYKNEYGQLKKELAQDFYDRHQNKTRGHNGKFITHFELESGECVDIHSDQTRLEVAIRADGSRHGNKYRFHLKKKRKINRLESLLNSLGIPYTKKCNENVISTYDGSVSISFEYGIVPKTYSMRYLLDSRARAVISEEVLLWDGHLESGTFSTTLKGSADVIQAIWASQGYGTNITVYKCEGKKDCYQVKRSTHKERSISSSRGEKNAIDLYMAEGELAYCFTTDTGMWVSRRDDCIAITGNCGHASFFKCNYLFQEWTDAKFILTYMDFAKKYVEECEEKYGPGIVERTLDAAHSLQYYGIDKYKRRGSLKQAEVDERKESWLDHLDSSIEANWDIKDVKDEMARVEDIISRFDRDIRGFPEENILYFLEKYSPSLDTWQREILRIVRKVAQYFYPQMQTKLMNEGWASFVHYHIMSHLHEQGQITDGSYLEFLKDHTNVCCQPDYRQMAGFNPYALGFAMFRDIERICKDPTEEDQYWFPDFAGESDWMGVCSEAMTLYRDESFVAKYLSPKVVRDFKMFSVYDNADDPFYEIDEVHDDEDFQDIRDSLSAQYDLSNMLPRIEITGVDWDDTRALEVKQYVRNGRLLQHHDASKTTDYLERLWGYDIDWEVEEEDNG